MMIVLNQIVNQTNVPSLFMATVINCVKKYPEMAVNIVNNILYRLIQKEVWKNNYLWDGFVLCCTVNRSAISWIVLLIEISPFLQIKENCAIVLRCFHYAAR